MFANTRGRDHPGLYKARSGHQFPIQPARVYLRMISEVHRVLFEIVGWSLDRHSDIRNSTNRLNPVKAPGWSLQLSLFDNIKTFLLLEQLIKSYIKFSYYFTSVLNRSQMSFCGYIFLFENGMQTF